MNFSSPTPPQPQSQSHVSRWGREAPTQAPPPPPPPPPPPLQQAVPSSYATGAAHVPNGYAQVTPSSIPLPSSPDVKIRIDKFVTYLQRNGSSFESMLRDKQQTNPEFAFLYPHGGADYQYYQWRNASMLRGMTEQQMDEACQQQQQQQQSAYHYQQSHYNTYQQPPQPQQQQSQPAPAVVPSSSSSTPTPTLPPLPTINPAHSQAAQVPLASNVEQELSQLLDSMTGSKESIKQGRRWFLAHRESSPRLAELLRQRMLSLSSSQHPTKLHLIYLINDVLHALQKLQDDAQKKDDHGLVMTLLPHLYAIFLHAYYGHSENEQEKVMKIFEIWAKRGIYPKETLDNIQQHIKNYGKPSVQPMAPPPPPPPPPPPSFPITGSSYPMAAPPNPYMQQNFSGPPPPPPAPMPMSDPTLATGPAPTDIMHLGPGFVVTLTKANPPYTPLDPLRVPPSMPPHYDTPPDAYTLSRLEAFYTELREHDALLEPKTGAASNDSNHTSKKRSSSRSRSRSRSQSRSRSRKRERERERERSDSRSRSRSRSRERRPTRRRRTPSPEGPVRMGLGLGAAGGMGAMAGLGFSR